MALGPTGDLLALRTQIMPAVVETWEIPGRPPRPRLPRGSRSLRRTRCLPLPSPRQLGSEFGSQFQGVASSERARPVTGRFLVKRLLRVHLGRG